MAALAAGHTVLAPNAELAAALSDAVERAHQEVGREIWPTPRVRDLGSWLRETHASRQLTDATLPRVLGDVDEREMWRAVIDSGDAGPELLEPTAAARAARRARHALHDYGIPLSAVASHPSASEESSAFLHWNGRFDERCRQMNCIGADELLAQTPPPAQAFSWIESPLWRPVARRWLERHGRMLAPPGGVARTVCRLHAASPAAELAAIADWAQMNLRSTPGFRAWICMADLSLRRAEAIDAFDAALARPRFALSAGAAAAPYALAGGTPLAEFAPVRAALQLLAASLGAVSFERFSALLRSPEMQASDAEAGAAALLDVHLRREGPSEADLNGWLALTERIAAAHAIGSAAAVQRLRAALRAVENVTGSHPLSRWVQAWIAALEAGPWELRHRWSSVEYQGAERFRKLLGALAAADSIFGRQSRGTAQRLLERAARDTAFQVQTGIPPIWVSGQLIDPWLNYQAVWISGCSDQRWPPPADPIPLLPVRLQREFGVLAAAPDSQLQFALDLQSRWAARAGECVFSYADPGDGRTAAASPLLPADAAALPPALPRPHWRALLLEAPALEQFTDELAPPFGEGERTRGVATLKAQSRCAFRGFSETRLRTEELVRPVPGFNERERGDLVHHALEHLWSKLRHSSALTSIEPEAEARLLEEAVSGAIAKVCRVRDPGPRWRERERERMRNLLRKWLQVERQREPFEVEQLDEGKQSVRHANLEFSLRIDRIDRLADGSRVLIDYKTGMVAVDWRGERPDNPQLPLYALWRPEALVAVAYGRVNAGDCSFLAEAERGGIFKPKGHKSALEGMPDFAALTELWSRRIEGLAADFAAGRAAVAPTLRACRSCSLQGLCRVPAPLEDGSPHD